jgi:hypothetical protein
MSADRHFALLMLLISACNSIDWITKKASNLICLGSAHANNRTGYGMRGTHDASNGVYGIVKPINIIEYQRQNDDQNNHRHCVYL